jgi:hypothetical protein
VLEIGTGTGHSTALLCAHFRRWRAAVAPMLDEFTVTATLEGQTVHWWMLGGRKRHQFGQWSVQRGSAEREGIGVRSVSALFEPADRLRFSPAGSASFLLSEAPLLAGHADVISHPLPFGGRAGSSVPAAAGRAKSAGV